MKWLVGQTAPMRACFTRALFSVKRMRLSMFALARKMVTGRCAVTTSNDCVTARVVWALRVFNCFFLSKAWELRGRYRGVLNFPIHACHGAKRLLDGLGECAPFLLRLDFLPPYSPNLNPIVCVWKLTRRLCLYNVYFPKLDQVRETAERQFDQWSGGSDTLKKTLCDHRAYAIIYVVLYSIKGEPPESACCGASLVPGTWQGGL
jgi:transposase